MAILYLRTVNKVRQMFVAIWSLRYQADKILQYCVIILAYVTEYSMDT